MKTNITLYCKSFRSDVNRAFYLLKSIEEFNVDRIPFYISTPSEDRNIFKNILVKFFPIKTKEWITLTT